MAFGVDDRHERFRRHRWRTLVCKRDDGGDIEDHRRPPGFVDAGATNKQIAFEGVAEA